MEHRSDTGETWKERIAKIILEKRDLDVNENELGARNLSQLIAHYMAIEASNGRAIEVHERYPIYYKMVKKNFSHALAYIMDDLKIPIYRGKAVKTSNEDKADYILGRNLEFITLNEDYKEAKDAELLRVKKIITGTLIAQKKSLQLTHPTRNFESITQRTLKKIA